MYNIFISHSWKYSDAYEKLANMLHDYPYIHIKDYSVPKDDPFEGLTTDRALKNAIRQQMQSASCVLVLAGVYSTYSKWINIEIEIAHELGKRIIAVEPWAAERTSAVVKNNADEIVKWNTTSIVRAIQGRYC